MQIHWKWDKYLLTTKRNSFTSSFTAANASHFIWHFIWKYTLRINLIWYNIWMLWALKCFSNVAFNLALIKLFVGKSLRVCVFFFFFLVKKNLVYSHASVTFLQTMGYIFSILTVRIVSHAQAPLLWRQYNYFIQLENIRFSSFLFCPGKRCWVHVQQKLAKIDCKSFVYWIILQVKYEFDHIELRRLQNWTQNMHVDLCSFV